MILTSLDGVLAGGFAIADTIKPGSPDAIRMLHEMGLKVIMLTGDNQKTAAAIGKEAGVDTIIADVLPGGKIDEMQAFAI